MTNCKIFVLAAAIAACCLSCVTVDETLGENYIPTYVQYDTYSTDIYLDDVNMKSLDSLSGFSSNRFVLGTIKDKEQGIIKKSCAFSLVPTKDTLDFGDNPQLSFFYLSAIRDTISTSQENQANIMQNLNVYELEERVNSDDYLNKEIKHGNKRITQSIPILTKENDLNFSFSKEFGEKYMNTLANDLHSKTGIDSIGAYLDKLPGIYLETDDPVGFGGRLNFFDIQLQYNGSTQAIIDNYALMGIRSTYNGIEKDTTFTFYFGATEFHNLDSLSKQTKVGYLPEYCLNMTKEEYKGENAASGDKMIIAGGAGPKVVIGASDLRNKILAEISKKGDPKTSIINKATLTIRYEFPEDYKDMAYYPVVLSPTTRISKENHVQYASLTEAGTDEDDIGEIDRSRNCYAPDITYHIQELAKMDVKDKNMSNYDIWMLILANEVRETTASTQAETEYYNQYMQYMQYYSMMYGDYGYGGYGYGMGYGGYGMGYGGYGYGMGYGGYGYGGYGYGGYGYGNYSNYYMYSMLNSMTGTTKVKTQELDIDRYYNAKVYGPEAPQEKRPVLHLTYSIPKE